MKRLVINADDYNLTRGCDRAIMAAMGYGMVTSASCLIRRGVPCTSIGVYGVPCTSMGVHLRLTDGVAMTDGRTLQRSRQEVVDDPLDLEWIRTEWRAQIAYFGSKPTHLDTHHHLHSIPGIDKVYADLCVEVGCAGVPLSDRQRDELRGRGVRCADYAEIRWTDGSFQTLKDLLARDFSKYDTVHLMCHPGYVDEDLRKASSMVEVRERELKVLLSPEFREFLEGESIRLIGMDELPHVDPLEKVDIIFLAHNRMEFTLESLDVMSRNTDWPRVNQVRMYADGCTDGMLRYLQDMSSALGFVADVSLITGSWGSPVAIMNHYLSHSPAAWFAKIDNDTVVPPGWLSTCMDALCRQPSIDLLGIEAIHPLGDGPRVIEPSSHIGGIGLMRSAAFTELPEPKGRLGFGEWQIKHPEAARGWLNPSIPVILLDRLPIEPWRSLGIEYERRGWQRPWKRYTMSESKLWEWWKP